MNSSSPHLRFGWWSLLFWLALGLGLEALHGFKAGWYLDVGQETRRLMLTLAHAHGTLLALLNIAAGLTARGVAGLEFPRGVSLALRGGAVLLPLGFLLGAFGIHGGDPGVGVWLAPLGGLLLIGGVAGAAAAVHRTLKSKG